MTSLNILRRVFGGATLVAAVAVASCAQAQIIFNDSFADGDRGQTGALDTNWWTSSSADGDEIAVGSLGLVTGSSGRGLHTVFATQSLGIGDSLTATYTFTTPLTVGSGSSSSFRVGLFDTLGRDLDTDVSASSGSPAFTEYGGTDPDTAINTPGLPGYLLDYDVNPTTATDADINFRDHNTGSATGRLYATTGSGSFSSFSSGPDAGYVFLPETSYTGSFSVERLNATDLELTGTLDGNTYSFTDTAADSFNFGFLGFHINSNQFGSSSAPDTPDNGIDFTNINVEFTPASVVPEPSSAALLLIGLAGYYSRRRRS